MREKWYSERLSDQPRSHSKLVANFICSYGISESQENWHCSVWREEAWVTELIMRGSGESSEDGRGMLLLSGLSCRSRKFPSKAFIAPVYCPSAGIGPIHLNEIQCTGNEKSIIDCKFNAESQGCNHEEDAGVRCNTPAMGLQKKVRGLDTSRGL